MTHARRIVVRTLAADTVREAVRGRWLWLCAAAALVTGACALFARELALTEAGDVAIAFAAPLARLGGVLIVVLTAVASVVRERSERTLLLALAAPTGRGLWTLGKAAGLAAIAAVTALLLSVPVWIAAPGAGALAWTASLVLELSLVACVTLAVAGVLRQVAPAAAALMAFYALARLIHVVLLLGLHAQDYSSLGLVGPVVRAVGVVVPRLDLFTRTDWLLEALPTAADLGLVLLQALVYSALALAVAVLDLRRETLA